MMVFCANKFTNKLISDRLVYKYHIKDIDNEDICNLKTAFHHILTTDGWDEKILFKSPLSRESYKNMRDAFITELEDMNIISNDGSGYDVEMLGQILESIIFANKMTYVCTVINSSSPISSINEFPTRIKSALSRNNCNTILDLIILYSNNKNAKNLKGIGERTFDTIKAWLYDNKVFFDTIE